MAMFYGINSNYASSLFSSLNTGKNSNASSGLSSLLTEYSNIQSGSYRKLLNSYYSDGGKKANSTSSKNNINNISTSNDSTKKLKSIKEDANTLSETSKALIATGKKSVFQKIDKKDESGKTVKSYDVDSIYKSVKSFVEDYNDLIESTEESNTKSVANNINSMLTSTKANTSLLKDIGIKINSDYTLSIDEETFKNSDMSKVKSLFNGTGSYAYQVSVKASMININVSNEINKSNTYTNGGIYSYNYSSGDIYNQFF